MPSRVGQSFFIVARQRSGTECFWRCGRMCVEAEGGHFKNVS